MSNLLFNKITKSEIYIFVTSNIVLVLFKDTGIVFSYANYLVLIIDFLFSRRKEYSYYLGYNMKKIENKNSKIYYLVAELVEDKL